MQGPPISGHPSSVRPRLSRLSKEPPPTSLHPPSYIDPSNEAGSIQTGPLRPDQYLNSPLEHQNASIGAEMLSREMLNPNVVLRNENGSQQIFEQVYLTSSRSLCLIFENLLVFISLNKRTLQWF